MICYGVRYCWWCALTEDEWQGLRLMMIADGWLLMTTDGAWWRRYLKIGDFWRMMTCADCWLLMGIDDVVSWMAMIDDGFVDWWRISLFDHDSLPFVTTGKDWLRLLAFDACSRPFWFLMMTDVDWWWLITVDYDWLWCLVTIDGSYGAKCWLLLLVWWLVHVYDDDQRLLLMNDGWWKLVMVDVGLLQSP